MDAVTVMLAGVVTICAVAVGFRMRQVSHQTVIFRDPMFLVLLAVEISAVCIVPLAAEAVGTAVISIGTDLLAVMLAADAGYVLGYCISRPGDATYVFAPDYNGQPWSCSPVVTYIHDDQEYLMPQSVGGALRAAVGLREPCDEDFGMARIHRDGYATNGLIRVKMRGVVACSSYNTYRDEHGYVCYKRIYQHDADGKPVRDEYGRKIVSDRRYLFHGHVRCHEFTVSQLATDDPVLFWQKYDTWQKAVAANGESSAQLARLQVQMETTLVSDAADIVMGMIHLGEDSPTAADDLRKRIADEQDRLLRDQQLARQQGQQSAPANPQEVTVNGYSR